MNEFIIINYRSVVQINLKNIINYFIITLLVS